MTISCVEFCRALADDTRQRILQLLVDVDELSVSQIVAAFDVDPRKVDRTFGGATCYDISRAEDILQRLHIRVAILAVPAPEAQAVAERLVQAGVTGILNFAPVPLHLGDGIFIEPIDMTASLEKVAFFARGQWARVSAEA